MRFAIAACVLLLATSWASGQLSSANSNAFRFRYILKSSPRLAYAVLDSANNRVELPECYTYKGVIAQDRGKLYFEPFSPTRSLSRNKSMVLPIGEGCHNPVQHLGFADRSAPRFQLVPGQGLHRARVSDTTFYASIPFRAEILYGVAIPFKLRFATPVEGGAIPMQLIASSVNLGIGLAHIRGRTRFTYRGKTDLWHGLGAFLSFTRADISKKTVTNIQAIGSYEGGNPAVTFGANYMLSRNSASIILSLGFDQAFGPFSNYWAFNMKPWLGFGLALKVI
jgi:hypothetical protein